MAPEPVLARLVGGPLDGMAVGLAEASTLIELPALPSLLDRPLPLTASAPRARYALAGRGDEPDAPVLRYTYLGCGPGAAGH
jgi:hypothetical protein